MDPFTALLALHFAPVRRDLLATGLPKGQRRALLVPLRREIEADARTFVVALEAVTVPTERRQWEMPGPPDPEARRKLQAIEDAARKKLAKQRAEWC